MASIEQVTRSALLTWLESVVWSYPLVAAATDAPDPGPPAADEADPDLPTVALWWQQRERKRGTVKTVIPVEGGPGVYDFGTYTADAAFIVRCRGQEQAEAFLEELPTVFRLAARDAGDPGMETLRVAGDFYGVTRQVMVNLTGTDTIANPDDTRVARLYVLRFGALVRYPDLVMDSGPTGVMNIKLVLRKPPLVFDPDVDTPDLDLDTVEVT